MRTFKLASAIILPLSILAILVALILAAERREMERCEQINWMLREMRLGGAYGKVL